MINISIEQALVIIQSLSMQEELVVLSIKEFEKEEEQIKILSHKHKVSMIIKDLKYKLNNEILNK